MGNPEKLVALPKYTIRLALVWALPVLSLLLGHLMLFPGLLAALLTPVEVPKLRQRFFSSRLRKQLPCLKLPALMRLSALWVLQVWWLLAWRTGSSGSSSGSAIADAAATVALASEPAGPVDPATGEVIEQQDLSWSPSTLSVVLPCAGEGEYALKTVRAIHESMPAAALKEIIVVDDGSSPPLSESHLGVGEREKYGVTIIRHDSTVGLIGAKKDGGDAATGDIVVFLDCHVAPQPGWHSSFLRLIGENYRRIVMPVITDLDVSTWTQRSAGHGQAKCYLTWDADFKWFDSEDQYVPILSGGLLGMSRRWWNETGGYDEQMVGWGGENLDQSLRSWLCGGEIVSAQDAHIAHMWRVPSDPRTKANYHVGRNAAATNRARAAMAWYGEFAEKLKHFPSLSPDQKAWGGGPWYGDISNILAVKKRLKCRSFAWFMRRFKHVYEDGGLIPAETFLLKSATGTCLTYLGSAGTSPDGKGRAVLKRCDPDDERQRWHGANRDAQKPGKPCCSGLRAWNTDQCLSGAAAEGRAGGATTFVCDIAGARSDQQWSLDAEGQLRRRGGGFMGSTCLEADQYSVLRVQNCRGSMGFSGAAPWTKYSPQEPLETRLYNKALDGGRA